MIEGSEIPVLKISDYNTTGLNGDDADRNGEWYRLIKSTGASSMSGEGGGSYGIGKGAPFAASALRMVFYSTINENGEHIFQGKSRITSFTVDGDVKRGTGFLGLSEEVGVSSVRTDSEIPELFRRSEQGTDIYIIGYLTEEEDWRKLLIQSVLANFWAGIHYEELTVSFSDGQVETEEINKENLEEYLNEYSEDERDEPLYFYKALTEGIEIEEDLDLLGNCSLFVKKAEDYPKMVQLMRKSKMVIETKPPSAFRVLPEPFSAVFICQSEKGNILLRKLEPPAHDKWDLNRYKQAGKKVINEMQDFIRNSLRSLAQKNDDNPEEIPELGHFLPEDEELETGSGGDFPQTDPRDNPFETGSESGSEIPAKTADVNPIRKRKAPIIKKGVLDGKQDRVKQDGKGGKGEGGSATPSEDGTHPYLDISAIRFRAREIREDEKLLYKAVITSEEDQKGNLKIQAVGEDSSYPLEIENVIDEDGNKLEFNGSEIKNLNLIKDQPIRLHIKFNDDKRYSLGVN